MSTGDLNGNVQRLLRELRAIKYPADVDEVGLRLGDPVALLPLLSFALLKFSRHVARFIVRNGFELAGKTDQRFVEASFKLFRDVLNVRTVLTPVQFFEQGFAERKVLLLCDIIAVCRKIHNEEVRHERLAALKASRQPPLQEHASSRTPTARRTSPVVKVVRNEGVEIHQVLAPQHLPNATDGAQSVYRARKTVALSPSPSPSGPPGKPTAWPQTALESSHSSRKGNALEVTLRPAVCDAVGQGQATGSRRAASPTLAPPIHTWFLNPAFDESAEGVANLGLSFGLGLGAGRPDSSAWWNPAASPGEQAAVSAHHISITSAAARSSPPPPAIARDADASKHLYFGGQAGPPAPPSAAQRQPGQQQLRLRQQELRQEDTGIQQRLSTSTHRNGSAAGPGPAAAGAAAGGGAAASSSSGFATRELDEWSFSTYFGPGKVTPPHDRRPNSAPINTDSGQQRGVSEGGGATGIQPDEEEEAVDEVVFHQHEQLGRHSEQSDRPVMHQGRWFTAPERTAPGAHGQARTTAARQDGQLPSPRQPKQRQTALAAVAVPSAVTVDAGMSVDWPGQLARLERETEQLRDRLAAAEEELAKCREEARQSRDALQARVTVLEGRVRFLECELDLCVKRHSGPNAAPAANAGVSSPAAAAMAGQELNAGWPSPTRPRSASPTLQAARPAGALAFGSPSRQPAAAGPATATSQAAAEVTAAADAQQGGSQTAPFGASRGPAAFSGGEDRLRREPYSSANTGLEGSMQLRSSLASTAGTTSAASGMGSALYPSRPLSMAPAAPPPEPAGQRVPSFSPMPRPSFSFQPSSLMQQVAAATTGAQLQAEPAGGVVQRFGAGSRALGSSIGGAPAASQSAATSVTAASYAGSFGGEGMGSCPTQASLDVGVPSGPTFVVAASAGTVSGVGMAGSSSSGHVPAWRAPERPAVRHGVSASILDGVSGAGAATQAQQQQYSRMPPGMAVTANGPRLGTMDVHSVTSVAPNLPSASTVTLTNGTTTGFDSDANAIATPAAGLPGPSSLGDEAATGGAYRSTNDLINSLYMRYTEAQDFLQTLRKR